MLAVSAALSWAIGVILFKRCGDHWSPMGLNLFKNAVAIVLFFPTLYIAGEPIIPDVPDHYWMLLAASGILGITVADTLFFMALNRLGAGLTAVVDTSYTPIMLGLSAAVLGEPIGLQVIVGAVLIAGALLVGSATRPAPGKTRRDVVIGSILGVIGIFAMGISIVMIKEVLNATPYIWATSIRIIAAEVALVLMIVLSGRGREVLREFAPSQAWKTSFFASFFGTFVAMTAWIGGMKYTRVSVASLLNQLSTVFIFILATAVLKEPLTRRRIAAICLAFTGAVLIVLR
ncbi:MAG: DMT family transporter [Myxococcota bacterium]|nr:DMT family transporter [Myxococcota bacterium]